jgi:hypothetical protein
MSISRLIGRVQVFAQHCYETYDIETLEAALTQPVANAADCSAWGITPDEWFIAVAVALNERLTERQTEEGAS